MATPLTVYFNSFAASATVATANPLVTATGGSNSVAITTKIGTTSGWVEIFAQGSTLTVTGAGAIGAPTGQGWFLDDSTLDGQDIIAGNWTPTWRLKLNGAGATATADLVCRAYVYNAGVYSVIGSVTLAAQALTTTTTTYAFSAASLPAGSFPAGSRLYIDAWVNITTPATPVGTSIGMGESTTSGTGTNSAQVVTPGYAPSGAALTGTLGGVGQLSGALSAALSLGSATAPGTGAISGTLSTGTALSATLIGGATLSGATTLVTHLAVTTLAGGATLSGTLHQTGVALFARLAGRGTCTGTRALTLYPNKVSASATLSTANQLIGNATINSTGVTTTNLVGTATGFGEITSQGTTAPWAAGTVNLLIPPTGRGWFLDASTLDMSLIVAGSWQAAWRGKLSNGTATVTLYTRIYSYLVVGGVGVYTQIGVLTQTGASFTSAATTYTSSAQPQGQATFPPGSHLYIDLWANITVNGMGGGDTIGINQSSIAGAGENTCNIVTPGYTPWTPPVGLPFYDSPYGFSTPPGGGGQCHYDTALACGMTSVRVVQDWTAIDTSGTFPSDPSTWNWTQTDIDIQLATQNGFNYTFVLSSVPTWGQWTPPGSACLSGTRTRPDYALFVIAAVLNRYNGGQVPGAVIARVEPINEGMDDHGFGDACNTFEDLVLILHQVYPWIKAYYPNVLVGTAAHFNREAADITAVQTSLYTGQYGSAKGLFDYSNYHWYGTVNLTGTQYDGPDGPQGGAPAKDTFNQEWQDIHAVDVTYGNGAVPVYVTETGMGVPGGNGVNTFDQQGQYMTTVLSDGLNSGGVLSHVFIWTIENANGLSISAGCATPTYRPAFYTIQAMSTQHPQWLAVPLFVTFGGGATFSGTGTFVTHLSSATLAGTATLSVTLSATTALGSTLAGVSQFSGTPMFTTALAITAGSLGTLSGTTSLVTSLSGQVDGAGTLTGALAITAVFLSATLAGSATCSATLSSKFALAVTLGGVGRLSGALSIPGSVQLAGTLGGTGTVAGTVTLTTALAATCAGAGTLAVTLSASCALSGQVDATGTLSAGPFTLATQLSGTSGSIGAISGTLSAGTALAGVMPGASTFSGAPFLFATALAGALVSTGTLSGAMTLTTALLCTYVGTGTLTGTLTIGGMLSGALMAGTGTLSGALSFPGPSATATWVTRDLKTTWVTRDDKAIWTTRR